LNTGGFQKKVQFGGHHKTILPAAGFFSQWRQTHAHAHWSTPHMNNSAASQEEREKESGRGGKIKSKLAHQQSFFCCFPLALSQPTERKSNRSKKGSPKPKTDESGRRSGRDGLPHLHTHTHKKLFVWRLISVRSGARRSSDWQRKSLAVAR
jgi:hypothetical protein